MIRTKRGKYKKTLIREALIETAKKAGLDTETFQDGEPLRLALRRGNAAKLTYTDMVLISELGDAEKSQEEIATLFKVDRSTISRVQAAMADTRPYAKRRLHAAAAELAEVAITASQIAGTTGDADPALELLDRLDVVPKRTQAPPQGPRVLVVVGQPGATALPDALVHETRAE